MIGALRVRGAGVGEIARVTAKRATRGMCRHDRHARRLQHGVERFVGDVGDVDDHAEVVHRPHDVASEIGQTVVPSGIALVSVARNAVDIPVRSKIRDRNSAPKSRSVRFWRMSDNNRKFWLT